ncbi:MAG TPA: uroporphyrinogen decarboxylase family protein [Candidatus Latescibacteria bacterium]|nr:uroporphyrinogen decarboxylase family protein [Candidatus Latescibacterota bacterium]
MTDLERFLAICRGDTPDYVPIFGFPGAPGMSDGAMRKTHERLVATGMPSCVGGSSSLIFGNPERESWRRYWGTTGPLTLDFGLAGGAQGFRTTRRFENGFVIIESESGEITRQVVENDVTYSMPEFVRYPVRDRESWEFYIERTRPRRVMSREDMETNCRRYDKRDRPLCVGAGSTYGHIRGLMGTEGASVTLIEDPELAHDIIGTGLMYHREFVFPLIERLRPEIVQLGEDLCFNHGMLLSPRHFREFCGQYYREVCDCAFANGAEIVAIDTDGNAMEFTGVAAEYGVNAMFPYEVKAGNDLFELRQKHPGFVFFGWLEKEVANEGNESLIEPEISSKVPQLLQRGRYFPNGDHGIQPPVTFRNLCRFMTLLHEVCGNPEGEFPRV